VLNHPHCYFIAWVRRELSPSVYTCTPHSGTPFPPPHHVHVVHHAVGIAIVTDQYGLADLDYMCDCAIINPDVLASDCQSLICCFSGAPMTPSARANVSALCNCEWWGLTSVARASPGSLYVSAEIKHKNNDNNTEVAGLPRQLATGA
jgi:hypothetical protein